MRMYAVCHVFSSWNFRHVACQCHGHHTLCITSQGTYVSLFKVFMLSAVWFTDLKCLSWSVIVLYMCVPAKGQLKPLDIDSVAVERDATLHQVALCCLLNVVDLPFLDGIANHNESEQVGWPLNSCCNGLKLTYENPLFASMRLLFHLWYRLMYIINILMHPSCCILYVSFA